VSQAPQSESRGPNGRFAKGNPGGPGRPRKIVKAAADALDERVAKAAPELFDLAVDQARGGSHASLKMLLERIWPVGRGRALEIAVPQINGVRDLLPVAAALSNTVLAGEVSAREGADVARVLRAHIQAIELVDVVRQIEEIEEAAEEEKKKRRRK
jgi:hypothetical protein